MAKKKTTRKKKATKKKATRRKKAPGRKAARSADGGKSDRVLPGENSLNGSRRGKPVAQGGLSPTDQNQISPQENVLSVAELVKKMKRTPPGKELIAADVKRDLKAGAPHRKGGKIELIEYCAWLLTRHGYGKKTPGKGKRK